MHTCTSSLWLDEWDFLWILLPRVELILTVSARAALLIPCEWELLELLVKSSIDLSAGFTLSGREPPFSKLSASNLKSLYKININGD